MIKGVARAGGVVCRGFGCPFFGSYRFLGRRPNGEAIPSAANLRMPGPYNFLKSRSKALRASSGLRGAGGPGLTGGVTAGPFAVPSRATVTRGLNSVHSLALSFTAMRTGMGFRHWKRVEGSKCEHCLQQCRSTLHLGQAPLKSVPGGSAVEQLKHRDAATCWTRRGRRGPVTSRGGRGPCGLGRSSRGPRPFRSESMYPCCRYLRSLSMGENAPLPGIEEYL